MEQDGREGARPVYVLGAGFSKAISHLMPVTSDLGDQIRSRLSGVVDVRLRREQSFEQWLTLQLTPMPFLQAFENTRRAADGERVIAAIAEVLDDYVSQVTAAPLPEWLGQLIAIWHQERAAVLTFNYDTLVERAVNALPPVVHRGNSTLQILGDHVTYPAPAAPPAQIMGDTGSPHVRDSLQLLHLHGSLAWYWSSSDASGSTLIRVRERGALGGDSLYGSDDDFNATHTLDRYLIPPVTSKEGYYGSYLAVSIWRAAKELMERASSLNILGYSLPLEDRAASQLFTHFPKHLTSRVADHNPGTAESGEGIVGHLATLGIGSQVDARGANAISEFVARKLDQAIIAVSQATAFTEFSRRGVDVVVALGGAWGSAEPTDLYLLVRERDGAYEARKIESSWTWGGNSTISFRERMLNMQTLGDTALDDFLTVDSLYSKVSSGEAFAFFDSLRIRQYVVIGVEKATLGGLDVLVVSTAPVG